MVDLPPSGSDHQDYYIFGRESLETCICHCYCGGGRSKEEMFLLWVLNHTLDPGGSNWFPHHSTKKKCSLLRFKLVCLVA